MQKTDAGSPSSADPASKSVDPAKPSIASPVSSDNSAGVSSPEPSVNLFKRWAQMESSKKPATPSLFSRLSMAPIPLPPPIPAVVRLPVLRFQFSLDGPHTRVVIHRLDIDGRKDTFVPRMLIAGQNRLLDGFEDNLSVRLHWPSANAPLGIGFMDADANIQLEAEQPFLLLAGSRVAGTLAVHSSAAVDAEAIQSHGLDIEAPAFKTHGVIEVHQARLVVRDLELPQPFHATQDIGIIHGGGIFQVGDNLQAQGLSDIQFQSQDTLQQSFNVQGSLRLSLAPTVTEPWVLLHSQEAKHYLELESPVPLTAGNAEKRVNLTANKGELLIKTRGHILHKDLATDQEHRLGFHLVNGVLMGTAGARVQAQADITVGTLQKTPSAPKLATIGSGGLIFLESQGGAQQWHQCEIEGRGLRVQGTTLDNVSSQIIIHGDASFYLPSIHRLFVETTPQTVTTHCHQQQLRGSGWINITPTGTSIRFMSQTLYTHRNATAYMIKALTEPADIQIQGQLETFGKTELIGSRLYCTTFKGDLPFPTHVVPQTVQAYYRSIKLFLNRDEVLKIHEGYEIVPGIAIPAVFSKGTPLVAVVPNLCIDGSIVSAPSITFTGMQNATHGIQISNHRSPPLAPWNPRHRFIDYAPTSTNLYQITQGGDTVYKALIPRAMPRLALDPVVVMDAHGAFQSMNPSISRYYTLEQEEQILVSLLMFVLGKGSLSADLHEPLRMLSTFKHNAARLQLAESTPGHALALRGAHPRTVHEPFVHYYEMAFKKDEGSISERVYFPGIEFPDSFNDPRVRDGAGFMNAFDGPMLLQGTGIAAGATFRSTGHLHGRSLLIQDFAGLALERNTRTEYYNVTWRETTRGLLHRKHNDHSKIVAVTTGQAGNSVTSETEIVGRRIGCFQKAGLHMKAGEEGVNIDAHQIIEYSPSTMAIGATATTERTRSPLGHNTVRGPSLREVPVFSDIIESRGPVVLRSHFGHYDTLQIISPVPPRVEADILQWHYLLHAIAQREQTLAEEKRERERMAMRESQKMWITLGIAVPVSVVAAVYVASVATASMLAANAAAAGAAGAGAGAAATTAGVGVAATSATVAAAVPTLTLAQTLTVGALAGFTGSIVQGMIMGDPSSPERILGGIVTGAVGAGVDLRFPDPGVERWAAQAGASATIQMVVHRDGNFVQNAFVAFAANAVADTLMPIVPVPSATSAVSVQQLAQTSYPSMLELSMRGAAHALVETGVAAVLRASPNDIMDLAIAMVGGMTGPLARAAGQDLAARTTARASQARQVAVLKQQLTHVSENTSEALKTQGIKLSAETIKEGLQKHPALQGTPEQVGARLIAIGQQQSEQPASSSAAPRSMGEHLAAGIDWVLNTTLNVLVPQAQAMELDGPQPIVPMYNRHRLEQAWFRAMRQPAESDSVVSLSHKPFSLDSILPDSDPNPFLNYAYSLGRAIELGRNRTVDVVLHPIDTVVGLGVTVWDGYNALGELAFDFSTPGSRARNDVRGDIVVRGCEEFKQADGAKRLEIAATLVTTCILGGAVVGLSRAIVSTVAEAGITANTTMAIRDARGFIFQGVTPKALAARRALENGPVEGAFFLYRAAKTAERAQRGKFWSLEKPVDGNYAAKYGIPPENMPLLYTAMGRLNQGEKIITRKAPGVGRNQGGNVEVVTKNRDAVSILKVEKIKSKHIQHQKLGTRGKPKEILDKALEKAPLDPIFGMLLIEGRKSAKP